MFARSSFILVNYVQRVDARIISEFYFLKKRRTVPKNWTTEKHLPIAGYRWASDKIKCSKCYIRLNLHMVRKLFRVE